MRFTDNDIKEGIVDCYEQLLGYKSDRVLQMEKYRSDVTKKVLEELAKRNKTVKDCFCVPAPEHDTDPPFERYEVGFRRRSPGVHAILTSIILCLNGHR